MTASTSSLTPDESDVAEHCIRRQRCLAEQTERDQNESRERRQLELDEGNEELDRQNEERQQHHDPREQQHDNLDEILEEADVAHQGRRSRSQDRASGVDANLRQAARLQKIRSG